MCLYKPDTQANLSNEQVIIDQAFSLYTWHVWYELTDNNNCRGWYDESWSNSEV